MLDYLSISTPGGLVLWSKSYASFGASSDSSAPVNALVQDVLLNSDNSVAAAGNRYDKDSQSMMWSLANDFGLIFIVVWPRILHLTYLDKLLEAMKTLFCDMYADTIRTIVKGQRQDFSNWSSLWSGWDAIVAKLVRSLEAEAAKSGKGRAGRDAAGGLSGVSTPVESDVDGPSTPTTPSTSVNDAEAIARKVAALKARSKAKMSPMGRTVSAKKVNGMSSASEVSE